LPLLSLRHITPLRHWPYYYWYYTLLLINSHTLHFDYIIAIDIRHYIISFSFWYCISFAIRHALFPFIHYTPLIAAIDIISFDYYLTLIIIIDFHYHYWYIISFSLLHCQTLHDCHLLRLNRSLLTPHCHLPRQPAIIIARPATLPLADIDEPRLFWIAADITLDFHWRLSHYYRYLLIFWLIRLTWD